MYRTLQVPAWEVHCCIWFDHRAAQVRGMLARILQSLYVKKQRQDRLLQCSSKFHMSVRQIHLRNRYFCAQVHCPRQVSAGQVHKDTWYYQRPARVRGVRARVLQSLRVSEQRQGRRLCSSHYVRTRQVYKDSWLWHIRANV